MRARNSDLDCLDTPEGVVVALSRESHYLVAPRPVPGLQLRRYSSKDPVSDFSSSKPNPATVLHVDTSLTLHSKIESFCEDPEFEPCFLKIAIIACSEKGLEEEVEEELVMRALSDRRRKSVFVVHGSVPEGPCFVRGESIYRTWRLFPDIYEAFQLPTIQDADSESFTGISIMRDGKLMVPVPSRLHYPRTAQKPLNGVRVTVKDIIDLKGVKTTGQSRSYEKLYGPRAETAAIVTRLTQLGAVIIGKTKCTQFASSDQPTADWVDYHCPWNPRGDGYLSPRGSSTGTCVALAGYDWCDVGIGSDTGGSIRGPAGVMGLFALRPTHAPEHLPGILPVAEDMDTPGIVCRDAGLAHQVSSLLFGSPMAKQEVSDTQVLRQLQNKPSQHVNKARTRFCGLPLHIRSIFSFRRRRPTPPSQLSRLPLPSGDSTQINGTKPLVLLYPSDYWDQWPHNAARAVMETAVEKLEAYLGVKRMVVNLAEKWLEVDPSQSGLPLDQFLENTFMTLLWRGYHTNYLPFRKEYEARFGSPPYVHPVIQSCWRQGKELSAEDVARAHERKRVYAKWLRESVFGGDGFNIIMVYPVGDIDPFYRDVYRKDPLDVKPSYSWNEREDHQASLAGIPSMVIPVGQVSHPSKVTGGEQDLPVAISLMSGAGTDSHLTGLVYAMTQKDFFKGEVRAGTHAF